MTARFYTALLGLAIVISGCSDESGISGTWELRRGDVVETMTLVESNGILKGKVFGNRPSSNYTAEISGLISRTSLEFQFNHYSTSPAPGVSGSNAGYTFRGWMKGDKMMTGKVEPTGQFSAFIPNPAVESDWLAERK
jgi:hypothetical protein